MDESKGSNPLPSHSRPSVIITEGFASSGLLTEMHESLILVPALQTDIKQQDKVPQAVAKN
ncbi:hypothetical protein JHK87_043356 [Glycine soja]|nr:hypothetical protein JHK87_043356 [Glycine soja]